MRYRAKDDSPSTRRALVPLVAGIALVAAALAPGSASPAGDGLSGKQIVDTVCAGCHASGADGAPRIGDRQAWKKRASQGLTGLTRHAMEGIRKMPPHGGNPGLSDLDIRRAITHMVNQSGGNWIEPASASSAYRERSGAEIVTAQCAKCHESGLEGAPRIGDVAAWTPRYARGLDFLVRSAIRGHGGMPPRGGMADLTDLEIRLAIMYMFNRGAASAEIPPIGKPSREDRTHKIVDGMDVYLGVISAQSIRAMHPTRDEESTMHGGIPRGKGYYHINISLMDKVKGTEITDAKIELRVEDPVRGAQTKALELVSINKASSYGNYFRMPEARPYTITAQISRPGTARPARARFEYRHD